MTQDRETIWLTDNAWHVAWDGVPVNGQTDKICTCEDSGSHRTVSSNVLQSGALTYFPWTSCSMSTRLNSHDRAFDCVEVLFQHLANTRRMPVRVLSGLYGSTDIAYAFKKRLLDRLQTYFSALTALSHLHQADDKSVVFAPSKLWWETHGWLMDAGLATSEGEAAAASAVTKAEVRKPAKQILKDVLMLAAAPVGALLRVRGIDMFEKPKYKPLALRVFSTDFGLPKDKGMRIDWLLKTGDFKPEDTVFMTDANLSDQYRQDLKDHDYDFFDASRQRAFRKVSLKCLFGTLLRGLIFDAPRLMWECRRPSTALRDVAFEGFFDYLRWKAALSQVRTKVHVAYNDMGINHIFRNVLFERHGIQSVFYQHTNSVARLYEYKGGATGRHCDWAYMFYSMEAHWSLIQAEYLEDNRSRALERNVYGPFWSLNVRGDQKLEDALADRWPEQDRGRLVAAFNTSFQLACDERGMMNGELGHKKFLHGILGLLQSTEGQSIKILFKPKKPFERYYDAIDPELVAIAKELAEHPNIMIFGNTDIDAGAVLSAVEASITMGFASPAVEGLLAGKKGFYFDPDNSHPHNIYNGIPNMVAHSLDEMVACLNVWLNMDEAELNRFLDDHIFSQYSAEATRTPTQRFSADLLDMSKAA